MAPEKILFQTQDGVKIAADYYAVPSAVKAVVLLHMMPAAKESWRGFAQELNQNNISALAIDLRGHGQSQGGPDSYKNFSDSQHQASINDVEATVEFLKNKGFYEPNIFLAGASIGANLALRYLAQHSQTKAAILLSPGYDYRGVITQPSAKSLPASQAVYYAAATEDMRGSGNTAAEMARGLYELTPPEVKKELKIFEGGEHGTDILTAHPEFAAELVSWLSNVN
ncbi:MAG: alpha/beta hydrolase [Parcubacteria group bacterium]|nr:alpha/beta hydrolase [Parcubacteria group bacterium]